MVKTIYCKWFIYEYGLTGQIIRPYTPLTSIS